MLVNRRLRRIAATAVTVAVLGPVALTAPAAASALPAVPPAPAELGEIRGYPQQNVLPVWPDNPADASIPIGVIPYDDIAPKLNALQAASDRVSARVAGRSAGGYDLYAVTVTAPESRAEARQQEIWKRRIEDEPTWAQRDRALLAGYKTPLFVNANIHGNEWEGTDAALRVIEQLATDTSAETAQLLRRNRLVFNITSNPDGRVAGTRANSAGYDLNRDLTIVAQPETNLIRELIIDTKPIITLDLHGYVSPTLLHPSTPPHNVNNEYDLFIKHGLPNALAIEQDLRGLGYAETQRARIPFRDDEPGVWDDFPPIYVPSFAMLQSSIPYTIEAPLNPRGNLTPQERVRRSGINTDVHEVAIRTSLRYIQEHRAEVLHDQAEVYRRGWAGEPLRDIPDGYVPGWGPEDDYRTTFPRAYVIPTGAGQRSEPAAARLVDLLIGSGGRVWRAKQPFTADGRRYPAGSYVVDLHQPKRGLVNSLLEPGADITDRVDDLYAGPAAWSQGLTWGATVDTLWDELPDVRLTRTYDGRAEGSLPPGNGDLRLDLRDAADLLTVNALLARGVAVYRLADGSVVVPGTPGNRKLARAAVREHGVTFGRAPARWSGTRLDEVVVGYLGTVEERDTLADLGFATRALTAATLGGTLTADVDVLLVASTVNLANLPAESRAALDAFLARGGGVVGLGTPGAGFSNAAGLLSVTATAGPSLASGVANVVNHGGPVSAAAIPHAFISQPVWFTGLGAGVTVEQSYAADPLLSGWWATEGAGGQGAAANQASIVSGVSAGGNGVVLFGTDPTFRLHPKGLQAQLGRALLWAAER
ncbi:M14 family zinc carboxypeptidase [Micromonospora sp. C28SCA-DRY-2]|uniref:M14 family zinc carboxypeptidase n=1 Tax=Micromonospora sp. C28SCA-DRY-2 TaxID=3059522 RepID=UPI0026747B8F|nr:M14 family zinc carboxypeptidase [Micromonospora sp. C28SCA-DRY-2]MDO3701752.1 M14 family zinc carboxypeptidase [Micromonospora sp. C28SCA-DRY-2]